MSSKRSMCVAAAAAVGAAAGSAWALPPLTAHTNGMNDVTWSSVPFNMLNPNTDAHQHWNTDNLFSTPGAFRTYAAWDDNNWRYDEANDSPITKARGYTTDYGHGFMDRPANFSFDLSPDMFGTPARRPVPGAAQNDLGGAVAQWMSTVNQSGMPNTNGVLTRTSINFANLGGAVGGVAGSDITIRFADVYPTRSGVGGNPPPTQEFPSYPEIDPNGTWGGNPQGGNNSDGVLAFWTPSLRTLTFNAMAPWFFGNSNDATVAPNSFDFMAVALHEWGHVIGLDHPANAGALTTMFPSIGNRGTLGNGGLAAVHAIDPGTLDGARALYTIPIPAPGSAGLMGLGMLAASRRRRS